ncbi:MAG: hypothetical protein ACRYHQ_14650, partial [Janthinobacterium lividum]
LSLFARMLSNKQLPNFGGKLPYAVKCDGPSVVGTNNPDGQLDLGIVQADCQVRYSPINRFFNINFQGGQTVTVSSSSVADLANAA